tara:strand:+ start:693 stop:1244 length:552 start_codon:yes stop_codon:yes gene_type:complete
MTFTHLNNLLHDYKNCFPEEKVPATKMIQFLKNDENCFKRDNSYGHFTGSAWIVDYSREWVLMTHHRQLNLWLQFGGHADGCYNLLEVALKETREESGLNQFDILSDKIFDLDIHDIPKRENEPSHLHFDVRFIFETKRGIEKITISNESYDVAWIHKNDVLNKNPEKSIARMLKKTNNNHIY